MKLGVGLMIDELGVSGGPATGTERHADARVFAQSADDFGFEHVWVSGRIGGAAGHPAPLVFAASLLATTATIGVVGMVDAARRAPREVSEAARRLAYDSGGRFELAITPGASDFFEAWLAGRPRPALWATAASFDAARMVAGAGHRILLPGSVGSPEVRKLAAAYRDGHHGSDPLVAVCRDGGPQVAVRLAQDECDGVDYVVVRVLPGPVSPPEQLEALAAHCRGAGWLCE